jgi:hypothetical protein
MTKTTKTSAAAVSAALRRAGFQPMGSASRTSREGLRVTSSGSHQVRVCADLNSEAAARRMAADARTALADGGYVVSGTDAHAFYVDGRCTARRIVVEVLDGADSDLIGYAVCTVTTKGSITEWRLEPEVFGTRSSAASAVERS